MQFYSFCVCKLQMYLCACMRTCVHVHGNKMRLSTSSSPVFGTHIRIWATSFRLPKRLWSVWRLYLKSVCHLRYYCLEAPDWGNTLIELVSSARSLVLTFEEQFPSPTTVFSQTVFFCLIPLAVLELGLRSGWPWTKRSTSLCLSVRIKGRCHHTWLRSP